MAITGPIRSRRICANLASLRGRTSRNDGPRLTARAAAWVGAARCSVGLDGGTGDDTRLSGRLIELASEALDQKNRLPA